MNDPGSPPPPANPLGEFDDPSPNDVLGHAIYGGGRVKAGSPHEFYFEMTPKYPHEQVRCHFVRCVDVFTGSEIRLPTLLTRVTTEEGATSWVERGNLVATINEQWIGSNSLKFEWVWRTNVPMTQHAFAHADAHDAAVLERELRLYFQTTVYDLAGNTINAASVVMKITVWTTLALGKSKRERRRVSSRKSRRRRADRSKEDRGDQSGGGSRGMPGGNSQADPIVL